MNYLKSLKKIVIGDDSESKIANILPISTEPFDCKSSECDNKFKESCFSLRGDAVIEPLYETAKPSDLHFLVSTGQTDWPHDAFEENEKFKIFNKFSLAVEKFSNNVKISTKLNVTNEPINMMDVESIKFDKINVLLLPWFVWINGITINNLDEIFEKISNVINKTKIDASLKGNEANLLIDELSNIPNLEVLKDVNSSYILLCSHKTRDKKCGITAPIMKKEFDSQLRDLELYRDSGDDRANGVKVIFVNHVGGHKFAANVLIYNKHGEFIWFARCTPLNVKFILNETVLHHKVHPANVRACSRFDAIKW